MLRKIIIFSFLLLIVNHMLYAKASTNSYQKYKAFIEGAERKAIPSAKKVMQTIRYMVENKVIIKGACWDYLNEAFTKAGYPQGKRTIIHKGTKNGPYVPSAKIQAGDWLYYINHSYHNVEHSGLFIAWVNYAKRQGLIMSYAGEGRAEPARYKIYDLTHVYHIMRAQ